MSFKNTNMIKKILFMAAWLFPFGMQAASPTSQEILTQLLRNAHGGVEIYTTNGQTGYFVYVGTGYQYYFYKQKAYIRPDIDFKWGEHRYQSGYHVETASIALPVTVGYHLLQQNDIRITVFGGGRYEQIVYSANNNYEYGINNSQAGLIAGTSIGFLSKFSINVSYYHGLTSLYKDGSGRISSFSFSFNF